MYHKKAAICFNF